MGVSFHFFRIITTINTIGGSEGTGNVPPPPPEPKFLSCSFREKNGQIVGWRPLRGWRPLGNPGSATDYEPACLNKAQFHSLTKSIYADGICTDGAFYLRAVFLPSVTSTVVRNYKTIGSVEVATWNQRSTVLQYESHPTQCLHWKLSKGMQVFLSSNCKLMKYFRFLWRIQFVMLIVLMPIFSWIWESRVWVLFS